MKVREKMSTLKGVDIEIHSKNPLNVEKSPFLELMSPDEIFDVEAGERKYQLQLRVNDAAYSYMQNLATLVGAQTISELVRNALRELEDATLKYDIVRRADGFEIGHGAVNRNRSLSKNLTILQPPPTRRINVVLQKAAEKRLKYLVEVGGNASLLDIVMTGLGVLHTSLVCGVKPHFTEIKSREEQIKQGKAEFENLLDQEDSEFTDNVILGA